MTTTKQSTFGATIRTTILMASLSGLLVVIGALIGGPSTAALFLGIALLINLGSYFFSDKMALAMSGAKPVSEAEAPKLYQTVRELTTRAGLPMPRLYVIPQDQPNAFATGRNPQHSAVAVTRGILNLLSEDELRGVLAHELAHVSNRDILIHSVASAIGAAITYLAYMLLWFGSDDESPLSLVAWLALVLLAPIAATIIQLVDLAPARVRRRRRRGGDLRQPRVAGQRPVAARAGSGGEADAGQPGGRAALHRQALLRQGHRRPLLDPPADRGAGQAPAPDAPEPRLTPAALRSPACRRPPSWPDAPVALQPLGGPGLDSLEAARATAPEPRRSSRQPSSSSAIVVQARWRSSRASKLPALSARTASPRKPRTDSADASIRDRGGVIR